MLLNLPSPTQIFNVFNAFGSKKAVGRDVIPSEFIYFSADVIAQFLHYYFNLAFSFGIVPDSCKTAKVVLIHKSRSKLEMGNYRPISISTCVSKILEKAIYQRMPTFLKKHKVLLSIQHEFQKNTSATRALLDVVSLSTTN